MPGEDVQSWSTVAASNANADSLIGWPEGMPRAAVNDSARSMMAAIAKVRDLNNGSMITGGTANAQTATSPVGYGVTIPTGLRVTLKIGPTLTNTGATTLAMDGAVATAVLLPDGQALNGGEFVADTYVELIYNGTNWILLQSPPAIRSAFSASKSANQVITTGTPTQIVFDVEAYDLGSDFASNTWQPPIGLVAISAGYYGTDASINDNALCQIMIYKNGALYQYSNYVASGGGHCKGEITIHDRATGADTYAIVAVVYNCTTATLTTASTYFMGALFG